VNGRFPQCDVLKIGRRPICYKWFGNSNNLAILNIEWLTNSRTNFRRFELTVRENVEEKLRIKNKKSNIAIYYNTKPDGRREQSMLEITWKLLSGLWWAEILTLNSTNPRLKMEIRNDVYTIAGSFIIIFLDHVFFNERLKTILYYTVIIIYRTLLLMSDKLF